MRRALTAFLMVAAFTGCGDRARVLQPRVATTLDVVTPFAAMSLGQSVRIQARLLDQLGQEMEMPAGLSLVSRNPDAITFDGDLATGQKATPGTWLVASLATNGKVLADSVSFSVSCQPMLIVRVTPASMTLAVGESATAIVELIACGEATRPVLTWTSLNPAVASVDPATGRVTGVAIGSTSVRGTGASGSSYTVPVTVR
jgi:hypothetical protein